ncbi:MAG: hypothetical protein EU544_01135 [Promethearchaeota archaeon]|nr:MAG: hypothetical protein EU544_01135 [Candidatus Lokiarchaeota archaeon]
MSDQNSYILYDSVKGIRVNGEYYGSIISKCKDQFDSIIFSDHINITPENGIEIKEGLMVGFEFDEESKKKVAFSKKETIHWTNIEVPLEYSVLIPKDIMDQYDEGQFSDAFPFTINLLHTAGLFLNDYKYYIDHLDFFKGEILKNPISLIFNGICIADRVVIDHRGDPVFYDSLIVGRDRNEDLSVSYEPLVNIDDKVVQYIIILGIEELKF